MTESRSLHLDAADPLAGSTDKFFRSAEVGSGVEAIAAELP